MCIFGVSLRKSPTGSARLVFCSIFFRNELSVMDAVLIQLPSLQLYCCSSMTHIQIVCSIEMAFYGRCKRKLWPRNHFDISAHTNGRAIEPETSDIHDDNGTDDKSNANCYYTPPFVFIQITILFHMSLEVVAVCVFVCLSVYSNCSYVVYEEWSSNFLRCLFKWPQNLRLENSFE